MLKNSLSIKRLIQAAINQVHRTAYRSDCILLKDWLTKLKKQTDRSVLSETALLIEMF